MKSVKIKLLSNVMAGGKAYEEGEVAEVSERDADILTRMGKAEIHAKKTDAKATEENTADDETAVEDDTEAGTDPLAQPDPAATLKATTNTRKGKGK